MSVDAKKGRTFKPYYRDTKPLTVEEVNTFPMVAVPQMDIVQEDAEYYGIRSEFSQVDGITLVATYLPYFNEDLKLTGYKRRDWTKDKEETGHFTVVGVVRVNSLLFGQHKCKPNKKAMLYYVEGEGDVVATRRSIVDSLKGGNWEHLDPQVVGLNCGAGNAQHSTAHNEQFLGGYKGICCVMDNDCATDLEKVKGVKKGKEATEDISAYLLSPEFYVVKYPDKIKDPRAWVAVDSAGFAKALAWELVKYSPEKVIDLDNVSIEDLRKKKKIGLPFKHFPKLTEVLKGLVSGELITVVGPSGSGKSTMTRYMEKDIIDYLRHGLPTGSYEEGKTLFVDGKARLDDYVVGERLGVIRLEEDKEECINSWYGMELGFNPKDFSVDPEAFISVEDHLKIHKQWQEEGIIKMLDHFGSIPIDELLNKFKQLMAFGCRWFVLDHISMVISGSRTGDDRKELDIVMTMLAAFCKQYNVTILLVSHMSRISFKPPVDKDTGDALPFFYPVRKENLRGSASLEQLSWSVIGVEPEELPNRSRGRVRLVSLKNRRGKALGNTDTLWMVDSNGTFLDAEHWEVKDGCYKLEGEIMHRWLEEPVHEQLSYQPTKTLPAVEGEHTNNVQVVKEFIIPDTEPF